MQLANAITPFFHEFVPEVEAWCVFRRDGNVEIARFEMIKYPNARKDAADYARLRSEYQNGQKPARKTLPPPDFAEKEDA
jgi:hypothetical protein